jgi:hypothetical protein
MEWDNYIVITNKVDNLSIKSTHNFGAEWDIFGIVSL